MNDQEMITDPELVDFIKQVKNEVGCKLDDLNNQNKKIDQDLMLTNFGLQNDFNGAVTGENDNE